MKRTFIDKVVGTFSPEAELKRLRARGKLEFIKRSYDAAQTFATDDWTSATQGGANSETSGAQAVLRNKGSDAVRNNPYANRAVSAIASSVVGSGIAPNIKAPDEKKQIEFNTAWKEWGETTLCDVNGRNNFYGLQLLIARATPERGEALALKVNSKDGPKIQILESDHIASDKEVPLNKSGGVIQGVKVDGFGRPLSYFVYSSHPGESTPNIVEIKADLVSHVFRQDRPGQQRGVSWLHPVLRQLEDFNQFQQATLIGKKISACFVGFITTSEDSMLSDSDRKSKRDTESMMNPGTMRYLDEKESVQFASPPTAAGYDEYCRQTLRAIASGIGITYEALTSDYSQVNFSSGRMGYLEFKKNVEVWRWQMIIPQFCEPMFQHFLSWCSSKKGLNIEGVTCEWVPPAWSMIDPAKEIQAIESAIRLGLTTLPKAIKEQGYDPKDQMQEIADSNALIDSLGIVLDSDPRKVTRAGILQVEPGSSNVGNEQSFKEKQR